VGAPHAAQALQLSVRRSRYAHTSAFVHRHTHTHTHTHTCAGVRYGPSGGRRLVYFVDDMNMPFVDKYDTQSAIELLRQMIDYHGW